MTRDDHLERQVLDDPSASNWLKEQIRELKKRDPVDAVHDVECLLTIVQSRLDAMNPYIQEYTVT